MTEPTNLNLTIKFNDSELDDDERTLQARKLLKQMKSMDEVESASQLLDTNPPAGNKSVGGFLVGMLTAEISAENAKGVFRFLSDRLSGKTIEMEVEANGKKLKLKASSRAELLTAIEAAQQFVAS
ncbi:MAG: hypothetical protein AAFV85_23530 [Cyanobacteria bacterium J06634_6]